VTAAIALAPLAPDVRPDPAAIWWARITRRGTDPVEHSLVAVNSHRFAAGTPVDLSALNARGRRPAGWLVDIRYRTADGAVVRMDVAEAVTDVPVWFTETHHAGVCIPTVTLAAFTGGPVDPGALVFPQQPRGARQLGALRWQLRSGLVDTVSVAERGRNLGRLLAVTAATLATLRGWPAPHGDLTERLAPADHRSGVERLVGDRVTRLI
jgi:hypothetical protein